MNKSEQGVPPSGSGCQPTASAAGASSQSGIPNALKVWWIPQVPMPAFEVQVPNLESASLLLDVLAAYDLFQFENNVKPDYCNVGGLVVFEDGEWVDWYDDLGRDFDEVREDPELFAQAIEARQGGDGTAPSQDESAVRQDAPGDGQ